MKKIFVLCALLTLSLSVFAEEKAPPKILFRASTIDEETDHVWRYISGIKSFDANGYKPRLPDDQTVRDMVADARKGSTIWMGREKTRDAIKKTYATSDYDAYIEKLKASEDRIASAFAVYYDLRQKWGFIIFPEYEVRVTQYGVGGSYIAAKGTVIINPHSARKDPAATVLHEIFHIGIEKKLIDKYKLPQNIKERIVDLFMSSHFKNLITDYTLQPRGDRRIDRYLDHADAWDKLPEYIAQFAAENK
jgi:hypothetical protein